MAKTTNTEKWGKATAKERYGTASGGIEGSPQNDFVRTQDPQDKHGAKYDNDASGWVRGPDATKKPGFDKSAKRR